MEETGAVVPRLHSEGLEHGIGRRLHEIKDSTHAYQDITAGHFQQTASALRSSLI